MNIKQRSGLLLLVPIALAVIFSTVLQFTILKDPQAYGQFLSQFGPWIIFLYILLQPVTIIIAPIGGFFLQVGLLSVFPPLLAFSLIYLVSTPVYIINFIIARRYGRPLVQKVIGKHGLKTVDKYAEDFGLPTLIVLKIFQGGLFDYLSYAAGLTTIHWKKFLYINIFGGIPAILIQYFVFTRFDNVTVSIFAMLIVAYIFMAIAYFLTKRMKGKSIHGNR